MQKNFYILCNVAVLLIITATQSVAGSENADRIDRHGQDTIKDSHPKVILQYQPSLFLEIPKQGYSNFRIGAGTRSGEAQFLLSTLVTRDHIGLTTKAQPSFFWYQSKPLDLRFTFQLKAVKEPEALVRLELNSPSESGVHRIQLLDLLGISLAYDLDYEWMVAFQPEGSPSVLARGYIRRIEASTKLATQLSRAKKSELPFVYIEEGLWYDALEAISDLIERHPNDENYLSIRGELLQTVGLINELEKEEPDGPKAALALVGTNEKVGSSTVQKN